VKLFGAPLDSMNIIFCPMQGCFSEETFVSLKRTKQACPIFCTMVNLVDPGQHNDKNSYYHSFKTQLWVNPGQGQVTSWVDH